MEPYTTVKKKTFRRRTVWLGLLFVIIWFFLIRAAWGKVSFQKLFLASGIYALGILPTLIYFKRQERSIPFLPMFGIIYFFSYAYSLFNRYEVFNLAEIGPDSIIKSLRLALLGLVSLFLAFYTPLGKICDLAPRIKISWNASRVFFLALVIGFFGIFMQYYDVSGYSILLRFHALVGFAGKLPILAIAILYTLYLQKKLSLGGRIFLWLFLIPTRIILDLIYGAPTMLVLLDMAVFFFIYVQQRNRIPWVGIVIAGLIFFLIFSVRDDYRFLTSYEGPKQYSTTPQKALLYLELIQKRIFAKQEDFSATYERLSLRSSNLLLLSKVVFLTPSYIPYWGGVTYHTLLYTIFPRLIVVDKVTKNVGQEFGHRYTFLYYTDTTTSINLPQLIEMYINFGPLGVIIGMFIVGLIYRSLYVLLNHPQAGEGSFLLAVVVFNSLLNIESDFSMVFGSLIQFTILFYLILRFIRAPITKISA